MPSFKCIKFEKGVYFLLTSAILETAPIFTGHIPVNMHNQTHYMGLINLIFETTPALTGVFLQKCVPRPTQWVQLACISK